MPYYVVEDFVIDWIKLCHGIRLGFRWTYGQHTWYGGIDCLPNFRNFGRGKRVQINYRPK